MFETAGKRYYKVKDLQEGNNFSPQWWSKMIKHYKIEFHSVKDHGIKNIEEADFNFLKTLTPQPKTDNRKRQPRKQPATLWKVSVLQGGRYIVKACSLSEADAVDIVYSMRSIGIDCRFTPHIRSVGKNNNPYSFLFTSWSPLT